jgi:hypothetical protein
MSETQPNAFRLTLADKEAQAATLKGEIDALKRKIASFEPDAVPQTKDVKTDTATFPRPFSNVGTK